MRKILKATGLAMTVAMLAGAASANEFKAGEVIVKYKDGISRSRLEMNALYDAAGVKSVKHFGGIMVGFDQVVLGANVKIEDAIAAFQKNPAVQYAQPNYILHTFPVYKIAQRAYDAGGGIPCIPGFQIPGCTPAGGGGGGGGTPGLPGGGGGIPCIPGIQIPGCTPGGGGGGGGGIPGLPGGGTGGGCLIPGIPFPPGCSDNGGTPGTPDPTPTPAPAPATRPELAAMPADVNPPVADTDLDKAYGIGKIGSPDAWKIFRGSKDFIVADIDTGIDYNHEDLAFNLWRQKDDKGKEFVGYDFVHNDNLPFDDNEHGTHTAGTIGAVGGNGKGVSGVAQRISLMAVKFLSGEGQGTSADAIRAIDYAVTHGAKVLSNSWGGKGDDSNGALKDAVERARAKDVLFIAAAGNDGTDNDAEPAYPASYDNDNMIAVAATDNADALAFFSNYGKKTTHLAAPGVNIYSTVPGNKYAQLSGTSMACPHVAGAAALLWSRHPDWNYKKVKDTLLSSTDPIAALDGKTVTGGRLNILKALRSTE